MSSPLSFSSPRWSSFRTASLAAARQSASRKDLLALAALVAAAPLFLPNNYTYEIAILVGVNAIVCVGLNILVDARARHHHRRSARDRGPRHRRPGWDGRPSTQTPRLCSAR